MEKEVQITVTGTRPLIMHNPRTANPIDPYAIRLKELTGKRTKTDQDYAAIIRLEMEAGVYETEDSLVGYPVANLWSSLFASSKKARKGPQYMAGVRYEIDQRVPLEVEGGKMEVGEFLARDESLFYRNVVISKRRVMKARPIVHDWRGTFALQVETEVINPKDLVPIAERAGKLIGLGDWRPLYGTYTAEVAL